MSDPNHRLSIVAVARKSQRLASVVVVFTLIVLSARAQDTETQRDSLVRPEPYIRVSNTDSNILLLEIAARRFLGGQPGDPEVWLSGVSHIGDSNYYKLVQDHLDAQTRVLYEGISPGQGEPEERVASSSATEVGRSDQAAHHLQSGLARALGLVFQMEAIDYRRPAFKNSDLSFGELRQILQRQETSKPAASAGAAQSFESLVRTMQGGSAWSPLIQGALNFVSASPRLQSLSRLLLIELLGRIEGEPGRIQGLPPDMRDLLEVLVQRRNDKVIEDLKMELARLGKGPGRSVSLFYGAAHMPDLEARLRKDFGYQPAEDLWLAAFFADLSGMTAEQREWVRKLVDSVQPR